MKTVLSLSTNQEVCGFGDMLASLLTPAGKLSDTHACVARIVKIGVHSETPTAAVVLVPRRVLGKLPGGSGFSYVVNESLQADDDDNVDLLAAAARPGLSDPPARVREGEARAAGAAFDVVWDASGLRLLNTQDGVVESALLKAVEQHLSEAAQNSTVADELCFQIFGRSHADVVHAEFVRFDGTEPLHLPRPVVVFSREIIEEELSELLPRLPASWQSVVRASARPLVPLGPETWRQMEAGGPGPRMPFWKFAAGLFTLVGCAAGGTWLIWHLPNLFADAAAAALVDAAAETITPDLRPGTDLPEQFLSSTRSSRVKRI